LRQAGWLRARVGETSIEEVLRVTADTDMVDAIETGDAAV